MCFVPKWRADPPDSCSQSLMGAAFPEGQRLGPFSRTNLAAQDGSDRLTIHALSLRRPDGADRQRLGPNLVARDRTRPQLSSPGPVPPRSLAGSLIARSRL